MNKRDKMIIDMINEGKPLSIMSKELGMANMDLYKKILSLKKDKELLKKYYYNGDTKFEFSDTTSNNNYTEIFTTKKNRNIKFVVISDIHLGSPKRRIDALSEVYEYCSKNNIHNILNCGDLFDSTNDFMINREKIDQDEILALLDNHPFDANILNYICLGNHDHILDKISRISIMEILENNYHDLIPLSYGSGCIKIKNDFIKLSHKLNSNDLHKDSNSNHIITFAGHYHSDGLKNIEKTSNNIFYVPTLSDLQRHKNDYPGIYDVNFELNDNGYFKSVNIRLLKYIDKKFKLINEVNISLNHNKKNSNKILTK